MDVRTRGGVFGPGGRGGGIFDGSNMGFGSYGTYEQAAAGVRGLGVVSGLGQPPSTCPTKAISAEAAAAYVKCRQNAYNLAASQCKDYPGNKNECITPNYYDNFNKSNCFVHCAEDCIEAGPISAAQDELGRPVTGKWTWEDQVALEASGKTFEDLAPGCKGAAPTAQKPLPPPPPVIEPVEPPPVVKKKGISTAWIAGGLLAAAALAGVAYAAKKKKGGG